MKTVSTKLDNKLHNQLMDLCNNEGKCQSEFLRDLIQNICEDCSNDDHPTSPRALEQKPSPKPIVTFLENKSKSIPKIEIIWK